MTYNGPYKLYDGPETVWLIHPPTMKRQTRYSTETAALRARLAEAEQSLDYTRKELIELQNLYLITCRRLKELGETEVPLQ